jgi:UDP-hydrolysing UDP-N-acetyl-D-glucosamine 2-epimerase
MKRKICVVTGTRAEYGIFLPILDLLKKSENIELQLVVTTMHLSEEFGLTYKQIEKDGFTINEKIENLLASDTKTSMAKSSALATMLLSGAYDRLEPDVVLLLGDRFETHAAATTALLMNIPIAHIHGGEITEGAVDEQIRHSITKMSYLHFTSTEQYRDRVIQLGENPNRVFCTGAPGIDNTLKLKLLEKAALEKELEWKITNPTAIFTFHPETLSDSSTELQIQEILRQIKESNINVIFTYANADNGGRTINQAINKFAHQDTKKYLVVKSLGQLKYLSAMKHADLLIGNTSSGIIEAASFHLPVINIGNRQEGRIQSGNIINSGIPDLGRSISKALTNDFTTHCKSISNLYGKGDSAQKIVKLLEEKNLSYIKRFHDK